MFKKLVSLLVAAVMLLSVCVAASAELAGTYKITVWVAENAVALTKQ